jgi:ABC-type nitrate/sulfonate/bicarbonate transport system substrate-binding protein
MTTTRGFFRNAFALIAFAWAAHAGGAETAGARAQVTASPLPVSVIHFPGSTALPLYVASAKGMFAEQGLAVTMTPTVNSRQLILGVLQNQYDIGQAAIDNLVAYQEKQAAPELDVDRDLVAFMGTSSTNLYFVVQPAIRSYADLKGKTLAVDGATTGFAFVLRKMLELGGLQETDYTLLPVGGDAARLEALKAGKADGALMGADFAQRAVAGGLKELGASLDTLHDYQGTSFFARRSWAKSHRETMLRFVRALREAHAWIYDKGNKSEAARILAAQSPGLAVDLAEKSIDQLTAASGGLSRTGALDIAGIKVVLDLRNQYAAPRQKLDDPYRYVDTSYFKDAESR